MPILARRIPDNFFYFGRRRKIRSVGGYLKDIRRDRMARLVCRRDVNIFYGVQEIPQLYTDSVQRRAFVLLLAKQRLGHHDNGLSVLINPVNSRKTC